MQEASFANALIGVTLDGRYRLDAVLGEGGMGSVFRATHVALERRVAVKLLKPHLTSDEAALQRFAREARATMKVDSPHAVKVLDFGITPARDYYMVLEYLDGRTVQKELEVDGPFAPARVAHIAQQALSALGTAHASGLVHRDIKPDNLLLMRAGDDADFTKVLDFGVAKLMQGATGEASQLALTAQGVVFGTPEFMSPEQACGQPLDGRSDLYSLAATLFVMLTGRALFHGKSALELLTHHAQTPAPPLASARPALAAYPALDALLQRCLAKQPEHRPNSAEELAARFAELAPALAAQAIEPAIARAPTPQGMFHTSSFFQVLRAAGAPAVLAAGATTADGVVLLTVPANGPPAMPSEPQPAAERETSAAPVAEISSPLTPAARHARPRSRPWLRWAALITGAALAGLAIGVVLREPSSGAASTTTSQPASTTTSRPASITAAPVREAQQPGEPASPPRDPAPAAPAPNPRVSADTALPSSGAPNARAPQPARSAAAQHLRNAEDARRRGNTLRQLAEADLALQSDPRSTRARYLLGDALIASGDLERGCEYLRVITQPQARARRRAAGCPGD